MKVITNFDENKFTKDELNKINTLRENIEFEVAAIPYFENIKQDLEILNIKFIDNEYDEKSPVFEIKVGDNIYSNIIAGRYDCDRYENLCDWQGEDELGAEIGNILVEIAKDNNINLYFYENVDNSYFQEIKEDQQINFGGSALIFNCLAKSLYLNAKICNNFYNDEDIIKFDGRIYGYDIKNTKIVKNLLNKCQNGLYSSATNKIYSFDKETIENMIYDNIFNEINTFWDYNAQEYFKNLLQELDNKDYVLLTRKGKDFYVIPTITGNDDNLRFQRIMSKAEKLEITNKLNDIKSSIIYDAISNVKENLRDFLEDINRITNNEIKISQEKNIEKFFISEIKQNPLKTAFIKEVLIDNQQIQNLLKELPYYIEPDTTLLKFQNKDKTQTIDLKDVYDDVPEYDTIIDNCKIIEFKDNYKLIQTLSTSDLLNTINQDGNPEEYLKHGLVSEGFENYTNLKTGVLINYNGFCHGDEECHYHSQYRIEYENEYIKPVLEKYQEMFENHKNIEKNKNFSLLIEHNTGSVGLLGSGQITEFDCINPKPIEICKYKQELEENKLEQGEIPGESNIPALAIVKLNRDEIENIAKNCNYSPNFFDLDFKTQISILNEQIKPELQQLNELYWDPTFVAIKEINKETLNVKENCQFKQLTFNQTNKFIENMENNAKNELNSNISREI